MRKIKFIILFLLAAVTVKAEVYDDIASAIRSGDAKQVAAYFSSSIDLAVLSQEDVYSKAQGEFMVKDFFSKNPPKSFTIVHKGSSKDGILFMVGTYVSSNGKSFRTSIVLKNSQGKYSIQELRFENQ